MIGIVCTYFSREPQLLKTLDSFRQYNPKDFFVVIVDDGSPEDIVIPDYPFEVIIIKMRGKNWTQGDPAYNAGFKYALSKNPDIVIIQNAECYHFGDILSVAKKVDDSLYLTFGCYSQGKDEEPGSVINNKCADFDGESAWYNHPVYRPKAYHFCAAITAKNLIKLNGFDERFSFGTGYDDDYLLHQIRCLGLKIGITDNPIVIHQWHEHNPYKGNNEEELLQKNCDLFNFIVTGKDYRAQHLLTEDL